MTVQLPPTGERFLPEIMSGEIALEHQHRYHVAAVLARGLDVLDISSSEGCGAALLAHVARSVVGVDADPGAVEFATTKYATAASNLRFATGSCSALPIADGSVDIVVSFETIEHQDQHESMLAEIKRVLRPGGVLVISSPDRHEYSDAPGDRNPHQVKELYRDEFYALLARWFRSHRLYGQQVRHESTLFALDDEAERVGAIANYLADKEAGTVVQSASILSPRYFIAVASDGAELPALPVGTFSGRQEAEEANSLRGQLEVLRKHAEQLEARISEQDSSLRQIVEHHAQELRAAHERGVQQAARKESDVADEMNSLRGALAHSDAQFQRVVRSLSWRITRPLRVGNRLAARLRPQLWSGSIARRMSAVTSEDFDEQYYVWRYADVSSSGVDPYQHFVTYGRAEGRHGRPPKLVLRKTVGAFSARSAREEAIGTGASDAGSGRSARPTVLVVGHEATRTGAPILTWNICRELRDQYQVVALLLGKGPLVNMFDEVCDAVVGPYSPADRDPRVLSPLIAELCERYTFDFAVVNSIASRSVLKPLAEQGVPATLLVHEFFKFHCSPDDLVDAYAWAGQVVFSAQLVRDSADIERTHPAALRAYVLPQGKSQIPSDVSDAQTGYDAVADAHAATRIETLKKKVLESRMRKPFIVLGAGTIEYRKGVDLFVATAAEIKRIAPDADILMVWVGGKVEGYRQYADFLATQVEQSGLDRRIVFVDETPDLEALYQLADVCFISSRLDPLPNIALDAMTVGLPVLSFDHATGVAEYLKGEQQLEQCVVPFLNVEAAARRIIALYEAPDGRQALSRRMITLAAERFNMSRYVANLVTLSKAGRSLVEQEREDMQTLLRGQDFVEWFFVPPGSKMSRQEAVQKFVKSSQGGIYERKPAPGFYPSAYAAHHDLGPTRVNPFAHFTATGKPAGVWQEPILDVSQNRLMGNRTLRIGVHVHAFYPDLLADIVQRLADNELNVDLFVSVPSDKISAECSRILSRYRFGSQTVRSVPNRGRDIGPFLTEFGAELARYDVIGHFHTKRSTHVDPNSDLVRNWVNYLMETLLGGQHRAAEAIMSAFVDDPQLGLVFADDPSLIGWDKNLRFAKSLAQSLGLGSLPEQFFSFPVGTMFWARPVALRALFDLGLSWDDYPSEPVPIDGTMLHAIERLLPSIVQRAGFGRRVTYAPGITR